MLLTFFYQMWPTIISEAFWPTCICHNSYLPEIPHYLFKKPIKTNKPRNQSFSSDFIKGPFIKNVCKMFWFLDPLPLVGKFTHPPLLSSSTMSAFWLTPSPLERSGRWATGASSRPWGWQRDTKLRHDGTSWQEIPNDEVGQHVQGGQVQLGGPQVPLLGHGYKVDCQN